MKKTSHIFAAVIIAGVCVPSFAFAQTPGVNAAAEVTTPVASAAVSAEVKLDAKAVAAKVKATQEIDRRVQTLTQIQARVQSMQKITDAFKQNLQSNIQAQIDAFAGLKTKIEAGTDLETLKTDIQLITKSYRSYALFVPQARITAMADREVTVANMMLAFGTKLQTRVAAAQSAGADVAALATALTSMGAKLAEANTKAQAAVSAVAALNSDEGDKTKMAANAAVLKTARTDLLAAQTALQVARKDANTILLGLAKIQASTTAAVQP